jgi:hypothetical protein
MTERPEGTFVRDRHPTHLQAGLAAPGDQAHHDERHRGGRGARQQLGRRRGVAEVWSHPVDQPDRPHRRNGPHSKQYPGWRTTARAGHRARVTSSQHPSLLGQLADAQHDAVREQAHCRTDGEQDDAARRVVRLQCRRLGAEQQQHDPWGATARRAALTTRQ